MLIVTNLFTHYYFVCTVSPGFSDDPPRVNTGVFWAKRRAGGRARRELTGGVRWSAQEEVRVTRAALTRCRRCGEMRPEVSRLPCARRRKRG